MIRSGGVVGVPEAELGTKKAVVDAQDKSVTTNNSNDKIVQVPLSRNQPRSYDRT